MSPFERETKDLYRRHKKAAGILLEKQCQLEAIDTGIAWLRLKAIRDDDPLLHLEAELQLPGLDKPYKQRDTAQRKYNENIEHAAAHKDRYFEQYVQMAQEEMARALPTE